MTGRVPAQRSPESSTRPEPHDIAQAVRDALVDHPAVVRLDGGDFGTIATVGPGRRIVGVAVSSGRRSVAIGVVLRIGRPLPEIAAQLRKVVRGVAGDVPIDVTISDVVSPPGPDEETG
jgi:hypothetical protein